jgi:hypothetical protein
LLRSFCLAVEGYSAIACKPLILASFVVFIQRVVHHGFGFFFFLINYFWYEGSVRGFDDGVVE